MTKVERIINDLTEAGTIKPMAQPVGSWCVRFRLPFSSERTMTIEYPGGLFVTKEGPLPASPSASKSRGTRLSKTTTGDDR